VTKSILSAAFLPGCSQREANTGMDVLGKDKGCTLS